MRNLSRNLVGDVSPRLIVLEEVYLAGILQGHLGVKKKI